MKTFVASSLLVFFGHAETGAAAGGCQVSDHTILVEDVGGTRTVSAADGFSEIENDGFRSFVGAVAADVPGMLADSDLCRSHGDGSVAVSTRFGHRPLLAPPERAPAEPAAAPAEPPLCRLSSPWLTAVATADAAGLRLSLSFLFDERQILADQALLNGVAGATGRYAGPLDAAGFERFANDYADTVLLVGSPEERDAGQAAIAGRLPPEMLWLFRNAWQSTFAPFTTTARYAHHETVKRSLPGYGALAKHLARQCVTFPLAEDAISDILGVSETKIRNQYRVNRLH